MLARLNRKIVRKSAAQTKHDQTCKVNKLQPQISLSNQPDTINLENCIRGSYLNQTEATDYIKADEKRGMERNREGRRSREQLVYEKFFSEENTELMTTRGLSSHCTSKEPKIVVL